MKVRVFNLLATIVAVGAGAVTLLGAFVPLEPLRVIRGQVMLLAMLLMAWAVLAGVVNLVGAHFNKLRGARPGWLYSLFVVLGFLGVVVLNLVPFVSTFIPGLPLIGNWTLSAGNAPNTWLYDFVLTPVGNTLAGLMAIFLILAGYRLLRQRLTLVTVVFALSATLALAGMVALPAAIPVLDFNFPGTAQPARTVVWQWLAAVPATAGARGLLLGVALGTIATGLRHLLALDRPYGD